MQQYNIIVSLVEIPLILQYPMYSLKLFSVHNSYVCTCIAFAEVCARDVPMDHLCHGILGFYVFLCLWSTISTNAIYKDDYNEII